VTDSESTGPPFTESAKALYEAARTLAGSWGGTFTALRRVLAADVALARAAIVEWILMVVIAAVLFGTGWMLLTTIAVLGLHRAGLNWFVALSIPLVTATGAPFPGRDLLIFLAASTILLTLIVNGLTLPLFIRFLGVHGDGAAEREERAARIALAHAGCSTLREAMSRLKRAEEVALAQRLVESYERLLNRLSANAARRADLDALAESERRLILAALRSERAELLEMRDAGIINDETMRAIEVEIDDAESSLSPSGAHGHG